MHKKSELKMQERRKQIKERVIKNALRSYMSTFKKQVVFHEDGPAMSFTSYKIYCFSMVATFQRIWYEGTGTNEISLDSDMLLIVRAILINIIFKNSGKVGWDKILNQLKSFSIEKIDKNYMDSVIEGLFYGNSGKISVNLCGNWYVP